MPTLQGVTMQIECGGKPLEEYSLLVENDNIATCWIPTEAGKNFQIAWQVDKNPSLGSKHGSIHCYIDGRKVIQNSFGPRDRHDRIDGLRSGPTSMRPFQFSALRVTDDESSRLLDQSNFKQIGLISIQIFRLSNKSYKVTRKGVPSYSSDESFPDDDCVVHETCKKFGLHYVSLGESQFMRYRRPGASVIERDYLDSTPSLTFNFRYMSAGLLQAKGVVPASMSSAGQATGETSNASESKSKRRHNDSPQPTISKRAKPTRNIEVSSVKHEQTQTEDTSILQSELENMRGQVKLLERRLLAAKENDNIKREMSPTQARFSPGEIIDLT